MQGIELKFSGLSYLICVVTTWKILIKFGDGSCPGLKNFCTIWCGITLLPFLLLPLLTLWNLSFYLESLKCSLCKKFFLYKNFSYWKILEKVYYVICFIKIFENLPRWHLEYFFRVRNGRNVWNMWTEICIKTNVWNMFTNKGARTSCLLVLVLLTSEVYLEPSWTSMMKIFSENS